MPAVLNKPLPFSEALDRLAQKRVLPTELSSAELREAYSAEVRLRSLFSARCTKAAILQEYQDKLEELLKGETNIATARMEVQNLFDALGYSPEHGFAGDEEAAIPPAEPNTLRDLRSNGRVDLVLQINMRQCANFGFWKQGQSDFALFAYPCYELVRIYPRLVPRGMRLRQGALEHVRGEDWPSRWEAAGGKFTKGGRMIARKDDEIWGRLGSSALFHDALDTFIPPFAFGSGYGWREIDRAESIALGIIDENTEVEGQHHSLNENLVAPANLTVEMLDAALGDLEEYRDQLDQKIAAEKAAAAANPARKSKGPWKFTLTARNERVAANAFNPSEPRGEHGRWAKIMMVPDVGDLVRGLGGNAFDPEKANNWKPSKKEYRRILAEGRAAMERCMNQKRDVFGAVERPGLGKIDFRYGKSGIPPKFKDGSGVAKIIAKRDYEAVHDKDFKGQTGKHVARAMVETILRGKVETPVDSGQKVNITFKHFVCTLRRDFDGGGNRWLLTGFIDRKKRKAAR